ncbi:MAG TPA: malto-oligosyltrehalose synthase [Mycobacteriales bacterium]|nr:malto-oligosyltrehalose synthase [Mycobacteriales bacterium]
MSSEASAAAAPPASTYRVQLSPEFTFTDAAEVVDYLAALGVTHLYCSPVLQAAPGSTHGYDVVDHSRLSEELGADAGFAVLTTRLREAGMSAVVDVVPNHMAVPVPESGNAAWWDVLARGRESPFAAWFDVDWDAPAQPGKVLMPVLGAPIGEVLARGELRVDTTDGAAVLRYYDHVFPLAAGTASLPLPELVDTQHYRLAFWRVAAEELNHRRFFDISPLAALRVEDPQVFDATHRRILQLIDAGDVTGLRIDHPDGLADPAGYLRRLAASTGGCWTVAEKILEPGERLPADWACAGTTGYDAMHRLAALFVDPAGEGPLTALYSGLTASTGDFPAVAEDAKRVVVRDVLAAEVNRLVRLLTRICAAELALRDHTTRALEEALRELLVHVRVYRAYVTVGAPAPPAAVHELEAAAAGARTRLPGRAAEVDLVRDLALGRLGRSEAKDEFVVRFQQTTGPVMAKGLEDTAFYRYFRLVALNEVGGDPGRFGVSPDEFADACTAAQREWPAAMTTLSTHDTKRAEDVRARLVMLSELPREWGEAVTSWQAASAHHRSREGWPDANTEYLFWQTLVGAWPLSADRALRYLEKATREAKRHTSWVDPDPGYDDALRTWVERVYADGPLLRSVEALVSRVCRPGRVTALAQKLVQLTMPGVPDVYQGAELETLALVDPDNRRPVDYPRRRALLARLDDGWLPDTDTDFDGAKLLVASRALRLRRDHPGWFVGPQASYDPLPAHGPAAAHAVAFARSGSIVTVAPRLVVGLDRAGGWRGTTLSLPPGPWHDALTGGAVDGGVVRVADLLARFPVTLLARV